MEKETVVRRIDEEYLKKNYANKEKILHSHKESTNHWKEMTIWINAREMINHDYFIFQAQR